MEAKRVMGGLTLACVGGILLANQLGYLPWSVWGSILALWPVWVIAAGIDIIGVSLKSPAIRVLSSLVFIGALLFGALASPVGGFWMLPVGGGVPIDVGATHMDRITEGTVSITAGATQLTLAGGPELVTVTGRAPSGQKPTLGWQESGKTANVTIDNVGSGAVFVPGIRGSTMDVLLDRAVHWSSLKVDAGATAARIDLSEIRADRVAVHCGASDVTIRFGVKGPVTATVDGGVSNVVVQLPRGVAAEVRLEGGLTNATTSGDITQVSRSIGGGLWRTSDKGEPVIIVTVKSGLANLSIERI